jgi:membrane-bound metal-dependent hydrolase YbcI (DUF457 family)
MDTITHGIAGALIGKAMFNGSDVFPPLDMDKRQTATWAVMAGAMFPDSDVLRDLFSHNELLMITWHRSVTHSLLLLPGWSLLLALAIGAIARWRKWNAPSVGKLTGLCAIGILSHILLDLVTTFGTMIWSPLAWSRPAWDILFIIDFTFTAILLIPQLLAWAYQDPKYSRRRATFMWAIFTPIPFLISRLGVVVGAPIANEAVLLGTVAVAVLFLVPALRGWGLRVRYQTWSRAGLLLAVAYILTAACAHRMAFARLQEFASQEKLEVQTIGALPLPPSLWHWDGLVRAPRGVYEVRMDLSDGLFRKGAAMNASVIERTFYPDAIANTFIEAARELPEVQKVLWFSRFPVTRFYKEGRDAVVEIADLRFSQIRRDRPAAFTYRVRFAPDGKVLSQGWVRR